VPNTRCDAPSVWHYYLTYEELARSKKRTGLKKDEHFDDWFFNQEEKPKYQLVMTEGVCEIFSLSS